MRTYETLGILAAEALTEHGGELEAAIIALLFLGTEDEPCRPCEAYRARRGFAAVPC